MALKVSSVMLLPAVRVKLTFCRGKYYLLTYSLSLTPYGQVLLTRATDLF